MESQDYYSRRDIPGGRVPRFYGVSLGLYYAAAPAAASANESLSWTIVVYPITTLYTLAEIWADGPIASLLYLRKAI